MQISTLYTFVTVAKHKSMSRAARILYVSQPAITQQIRRMEKELGFELFDHNHGNEVTLSEAGKNFYAYAEKLLSEYEETVNECRKIAERKSTDLRIGLKSSDLSLLHLETVDSFSLRYPQVHLDFTYDHPEMAEMLYTEKLDMIFTVEPMIIPAGYKFVHVVDDTVSCIVRSDHPLAGRKKVTFQDLRPYRLYVLSDKTSSGSERFISYMRSNYPNLHVDTTKNHSMTVSPGFTGIRLCSSSEASKFHFSSIIPLQTGFRVSKGYLMASRLPDYAEAFAEMNAEAEKNSMHAEQ